MKHIVVTQHRGVLGWVCSTPRARVRARTFLMAAAALLLLLSAPSTTFAGSATWSPAPGSGDWNTPGNWVIGGPPNGPLDTATFAISTQTAVSISANTEVNGITFNAAASAFTITASPGFALSISGLGITNNSGITQNFVTAVGSAGAVGSVQFTNSATAGSMTVFTNKGGAVNGVAGGGTEFFNTSTAGNGTFTNNSGTVNGALGGDTQFNNTSTAGNGTFTNNGGTVGGAGNDVTAFFDSSTAGNGTFTNNGGTVNGAGNGAMEFHDTSTAGNGTFTNNGGTVSGEGGGDTNFFNSSTAGNGTFTNNGGTVNGAGNGGTGFFDSSTADSATLIANGGLGTGGSIYFFADATGGTARVEVFGNGILDISFHNAPGVTIGSIEGSGNVFLGANNLTVGSNNLSTTFSGVIRDGGFAGGMGGSLTKIGTGTLSLTNSNTYSGSTLINAGTLIAAHDGALGSGNVSLTASGVTLTLQNGATNNYISDHSSISIVNGATAKLNFTGASDLVGGIVLNGFNETTPGTYGSTTSGAMFESVFFSGTGTLLLVPEPATWTLMGLGVAMLAVMMRFRRRRTVGG
jgi:Passenger-associated-transport-repeat/PEP-CTERM motif